MTHRRHPRIPGQLAAICCAAAMLTISTSAAAQTIPSQTSQPSVTPSTSAPSLLPTSLPRSLPAVIGEAVSDFRHIPSWTNLAIFAVGGLGAALEHPSDASVSRAMSTSQGLDSFLHAGKTVGDARTQLAAAIGTY